VLTSFNPSLILASTSPYRRELLQRLRIPFDVHAPNVDETPLSHEKPIELAHRLSLAKAHVIAHQWPDHVVIGSDEVAELDGQIIGKPLTHERARAQLTAMRGRTVTFYTGVAVVHKATAFEKIEVIQVHTHFRYASDAEIENYLLTEKPYNCAGSIQSEGLGIALIDRIESNDPTSLVGLPLIRLSAMLRAAGINPLLGKCT
jgi:septum formation protein